MQEYFDKIQDALARVPLKDDEAEAQRLLDELKVVIAREEKALGSALGIDFYRVLAKRYLTLAEKCSDCYLPFYQNAVNAYHSAIKLGKTPDEETSLYDDLVEVYQRFLVRSEQHKIRVLSTARENSLLQLQNFLGDGEKDLKACFNESRAELLGEFLEGKAHLIHTCGGSDLEVGQYYKTAAEAYLRAMRASSGKDREKLCEKYFKILRLRPELNKGTLEERKFQLINFMDIISSNGVFSSTAEAVINELAGSLFKDFKDLTGYSPGKPSDPNPNPGFKFYFVLLGLMLNEYVSYANFNDIESAVSMLCLPENREGHKLTLDAVQKLLLSILRISQQETAFFKTFFNQAKANKEILQRCINLLTRTLEELPSRKLVAELRSEIVELKQGMSELRSEKQLLEDRLSSLEAKFAMLLTKLTPQSPPVSPRFTLESPRKPEEIPQTAAVSKLTTPSYTNK